MRIQTNCLTDKPAVTTEALRLTAQDGVYLGYRAKRAALLTESVTRLEAFALCAKAVTVTITTAVPEWRACMDGCVIVPSHNIVLARGAQVHLLLTLG